MAVTIFSIIGTIFAVIVGLISLFLLPFIGKSLKRLNRFLDERERTAGSQVKDLVSNLETTATQLESFAPVAEATRAFTNTANSAMDQVVAFLESKPFQTAFPLICSVLLLLLALPRGLLAKERKRRRARIQEKGSDQDINTEAVEEAPESS